MNDALTALLGLFGGLGFLTTVAHFLFRDKPARIPLEGARVLITGGSEGIGLAAAKECKKRGAHVAILSRSMEKLQRAAKEISPENPSEVVLISANIANYDKLTSAIDDSLAKQGWDHIDIVFCNAGFTTPALLQDMSPESMQRCLNVNVLGTFNTVKACLPRLEAAANRPNSPGARVAFSCSAYSLMGMAQNSMYCATKFAMRGLAESLDYEFREKRIWVSQLFFPDVDTPGHALEMKTLAPAIHEVAEEAGIFQTSDIVPGIMAAFEGRSTDRSWGLDMWMLRNLTIGMKQPSSILDSLVQIFLLPIFRLAGMFYSKKFRGLIEKHGKLSDFRPEG